MTPATDLTTAAMTVFGVLIAIVGGLLLAVTVMRRVMKATPGGRRPGQPCVIGSCALGVKKTVSMVEVPGAVLVLGVTADAITLLSRIDDAETIAQIKNQKTTVPSFADQLRRMVGRGESPPE